MGSLQYIDIVIILIYLLGCFFIGLYKSRTIKGIKEYTLGQGKVSTIVLFSTIFATHVGAGLTIGSVEKIHQIGLLYAIIEIFGTVFWLVSVVIFGKNIEQFKGCLSLSDIMYKLYGTAGKFVTNITSLLISIGVIAIQITAIGYVLNYFIGISQLTGILIGFGVLIFYSAFGGIRTVALTDVFQLAIFFVAFPVICICAIKNLGGTEVFFQKIQSRHLSLNLLEGNLWFFLSMIMYGLVPDTTGAFIQRFLMADGTGQLTKVLKMTAVASLFFELIVCLVSFIVLAQAPDIDSNNVMIRFIDTYLPSGIKGFMIIGLLAVLMSTADSFLNNASVLCAHDILKQFFPKMKEKEELYIARIATVIIGILAIFLAIRGIGILELLWIVDNFWQPLILIPLASGFLGFRTNHISFYLSGITAILFTCTGAYIVNEFAVVSMFSGIVGSAFGLFGAHYVQIHIGIYEVSKKQELNYISTVQENILIRLIKTIKKYLSYLRLGNIIFFIRKSTKEQRPRYQTVGFLGVLFFLSIFFINIQSGINIVNYTTVVSLHVIAIVLTFVLLFHEYFFKKSDVYLPLYWYGTLLYCCPFFSCIIILFEVEQVMILNIVASIFLLAVLVDFSSFVILVPLGCAAAYIFYGLCDIEFSVQKSTILFNVLSNTAVFVIVGAVKKDYENKMRELKILSSAIAHELRPPLSIISMNAEIIDERKGIKSIKKNIMHAVRKSNALIDSILINIKGLTSVQLEDEVGITECIREAISNFPLNKSERKSIKLELTCEFKFKGSKTYITQVITNLLKNSLYYVKTKEFPVIKISTANTNGNKVVSVFDNGLGMNEETRGNIFRSFYTKRKNGTGIGLSFCKVIMEAHGGTIKCISKEGEFTVFELHFP